MVIPWQGLIGVFLFLLIIFAAPLMTIGAIVYYMFIAPKRRKVYRPPAVRGFEVKIPTGQSPVIDKERENDHG
jgi:hypothetical protein